MESDRLLMEELKGELSQTKLELETTLKAQHKHLKELDTLRLAVVRGHRRVIVTTLLVSKASENHLLKIDCSVMKIQDKCSHSFLFYCSMSP